MAYDGYSDVAMWYDQLGLYTIPSDGYDHTIDGQMTGTALLCISKQAVHE